MKLPAYSFVLLVLFFSFFATASTSVAQEVFSNSEFKFDLTGATEAPVFGGVPRIGFPKDAIKNGVEGTLIVEMTLGENGKVTNYDFIQSLGMGYEEAVKVAFDTFNFTPAKSGRDPMPVKLRMEYTVTMVFSERDKDVNKPEITEQPDAVYPESEIADKRKGEVTVQILFYKDGTSKVLSVGSVMPKPFDAAALEAAKLIKFTPGTHNKNKTPISVKMDVVYKFKP